MYSTYLVDLSKEYIVKNFSEQVVKGVYKFSKRIEEKPKHTGVCILIFDEYKIPNPIDVTWHSVLVR